jgi:hypothetical protein
MNGVCHTEPRVHKLNIWVLIYTAQEQNNVKYFVSEQNDLLPCSAKHQLILCRALTNTNVKALTDGSALQGN